jgi:hypothetical protein
MLAVICEFPNIPKEIELLSARSTVPLAAVCVPAASANGIAAGKLALAVTEDPFVPNVTLFAAMKT